MPTYGNPRTHYETNLRRVRELAPGLTSLILRGPYYDPRCPNPHWRGLADDLLILASVERKPDGHEWLHVSFSRPHQTPDWDDVRFVRERFFPADAVVVSVLPPAAEYVNLHDHTLHLWMRIGGDRLIPDLRIVEDGGERGI